MNSLLTNSGRDALALYLGQFNPNPKPYILLQAFTCIAVPQAITHSGFKPVWCDIEIDTYSMDLESLINVPSNIIERSSFLILQYTYGLTPSYVKEITDFCRQRQILVIGDFCHVHPFDARSPLLLSLTKPALSSYFFSFESGKPLKLGSGGLLYIPPRADTNDSSIFSTYSKLPSASIVSSLKSALVVILLLFSLKTGFYWSFYKIFAQLRSKGLFHQSSPQTLDALSPSKMGILQYSAFIAIRMLYIRSILPVTSSMGLNRIITSDNPFRLLRLLTHKKIPAFHYFTTPCQPLSGNSLSSVDYTLGSCPTAEKVSNHVILIPQ